MVSSLFLAHTHLRDFAEIFFPYISLWLISSFLSRLCSNVISLMMPFLPNLGNIATTLIILLTLKNSTILSLFTFGQHLLNFKAAEKEAKKP